MEVTRTAVRLSPDPRRVLLKPFVPGAEALFAGRAARVLSRVLAIPEDAVPGLLGKIRESHGARHRDFDATLEAHFENVSKHLPDGVKPSRERRLLIGAYFSQEYSIESAALFNPSIVPAPDDRRADGSLGFLMSLRAVGEGHISSIAFCTGRVGASGAVQVDPRSPFVVGAQREPPEYDKTAFRARLDELEALNGVSNAILDQLPERFTLEGLETAMGVADRKAFPAAIAYETKKIVHLFASSNYLATFPEDSELSERVLFPAGPHESRGMEDSRWVRFVSDDGSIRYFATYTAYDGFKVLPKLIETGDFRTFLVSTMSGPGARNKGLALFPRLLHGRFAALARYDAENLYYESSDRIDEWGDGVLIRQPSASWDLVQVGNCGSPIETREGWLVLTHGVGPVRKYVMGALLLDLEDPSRVVGELPEPLLTANRDERDGYVPNVVYSCGSVVHGDWLVIPFGQSDQAIGIATVNVNDVLGSFVRS